MGQQGMNDFKYPQLSANISDSSNSVKENTLSGGKFDINKFNKAFEQNKESSKQKQSNLEDKRLDKLNTQKIQLKPYQLSIAQIFITMKDSWFELIDDLLQRQFYVETFTKKNRMFYIGLTIIIIVIIFYLYDIIIETMNDNDNNSKSDIKQNFITEKKIIEIHHIYDNNNNNINNKINNSIMSPQLRDQTYKTSIQQSFMEPSTQQSFTAPSTQQQLPLIPSVKS
jgi:heme/copper-type cytochrome/quinol oxidase subunit 1